MSGIEQSNAQRKAELKAFKAEVEGKREEAIRLAAQNTIRELFVACAML
jgi:hypothetical protein